MECQTLRFRLDRGFQRRRSRHFPSLIIPRRPPSTRRPLSFYDHAIRSGKASDRLPKTSVVVFKQQFTGAAPGILIDERRKQNAGTEITDFGNRGPEIFNESVNHRRTGLFSANTFEQQFHEFQYFLVNRAKNPVNRNTSISTLIVRENLSSKVSSE